MVRKIESYSFQKWSATCSRECNNSLYLERASPYLAWPISHLVPDIIRIRSQGFHDRAAYRTPRCDSSKGLVSKRRLAPNLRHRLRCTNEIHRSGACQSCVAEGPNLNIHVSVYRTGMTVCEGAQTPRTCRAAEGRCNVCPPELPASFNLVGREMMRKACNPYPPSILTPNSKLLSGPTKNTRLTRREHSAVSDHDCIIRKPIRSKRERHTLMGAQQLRTPSYTNNVNVIRQVLYIRWPPGRKALKVGLSPWPAFTSESTTSWNEILQPQGHVKWRFSAWSSNCWVFILASAAAFYGQNSLHVTSYGWTPGRLLADPWGLLEMPLATGGAKTPSRRTQEAL